MMKQMLTALALLSAISLAAPRAGHAQTFKTEKFDIKGDGGTDYIAVESATGRVFVSRATHMMVVEGATGKVLGDIPNTPGVHGAGIATKAGHGFTTNGADQTVTMFDLKTLAVIKQIMVGPGLDGIISSCNDTSVVVDPKDGKIIATIKNGTRVDALGWDPSKKLMYIPNGGEGNVTVVHQDSPDKYTTVATVDTFAGAKTIAADPVTHNVYLFQPERGPAPAPAAGAPPPAGRGRGPQGPIVASW